MQTIYETYEPILGELSIYEPCFTAENFGALENRSRAQEKLTKVFYNSKRASINAENN